MFYSGIQIPNPRWINEVTREDETFYGVWEQLIARQLLRVSSMYPKNWFAFDIVEQLLAVNHAKLD